MKRVSLIIMACSLGMAAQAQVSVIDPLNGDSLSEYTDTLVLDDSDGAGSSVSFSDSSGALEESFAGTVNDPEQALFLAPASDFSTTFAEGDTLFVASTVAASSTAEDFGLAISATATPTAAESGNSYNSRATFDWASISIRPSGTGSGGDIRQNQSISGSFSSSSVAGVDATLPVDGLFISWVGTDQFTLGYISGSGAVVSEDTITFASTSTIGADIGFYGDIRATGTSIGSFSDLSIDQAIDAVPEPSTCALCNIGMISSLFMLRRKK